MRRVRRIVGWSLLTLFLIFLAICTTGEIRQRILVHRAAALLSDIHSLRLHQSDWNDAQRFIATWGRWGHYDGACTSEDCLYVVTLHDLSIPVNNNVAEWPSRMTYFLSAFRLLPRQWGGGLRLMQATFLVQNGAIVRSGVSIDMSQSPFAKGAQPVCCGAELIISARSQASLGMPESWQEEQRSRHPDYTTWRPGGCTFCLMGRVTYADSIPVEEAVKLSDFQLSCATRWSSCLTLEELDPAAHSWHLYEAPWGDPPEKTTSQQMPVGCALPLYALGRDADRIVSVEALEDGVSLGKDAEGVEHESSRVRVIAGLKGASPWPIDSTQRVLSSGSPYYDKVRKPAHLVKTQRYFLMLGNEEAASQDHISLENCGVVGEDTASDREVRRGMAMDDQLKGFEPTVSLEGFARHRSQPWDR
ncbi:hypothetical protein SAMN05421771_4349 [Granulicella pectinivorans]|uniref:Uncharacterized protein n=1 Tax=Granulicella pectinivorans TaxID=474950 RepID=A0A1I6N2G7_9BACT|nr:hypothetical protein SAMN05421771_4349 [Granulicella pectinivorans]